jgi:hypothetical protein
VTVVEAPPVPDVALDVIPDAALLPLAVDVPPVPAAPVPPDGPAMAVIPDVSVLPEHAVTRTVPAPPKTSAAAMVRRSKAISMASTSTRIVGVVAAEFNPRSQEPGPMIVNALATP